VLALVKRQIPSRSLARPCGGLGTEFSPLGENEFGKNKRTIYRKRSHVLAFVSYWHYGFVHFSKS